MYILLQIPLRENISVSTHIAPGVLWPFCY